MKSFLLTSLVWAVVLVPTTILSQEDFSAGKRIVGIQIDTLRSNSASIAFDKAFNTYHWNGAAFYKNSFGPLFLQINEQFLSTLISTDQKLITDNQLFDLHAHYQLTDNISVASNISSFILSDNKSLGNSIGKASSHAAYGGIAYKPFNAVTLEPLIGFRVDNQFDQYDRGQSYLLGIASDTINLNGYQSKFTGMFQYDKISPRSLETHNTSINIEKTFFEQTQNSFQFVYRGNRRDFYLLADPEIQHQHNIAYNIETRLDNTISATDLLNYKIDNNITAALQGSIFTREINRTTRYKNLADPRHSPLNTSINELKIEGSAQVGYKLNERLNASFMFSYLERDEKHELQTYETNVPFDFSSQARIEERKNNHSRRTSMTVSTMWAVSSSDTIAISGSSNILRYDSPSAENDDDRDELWHIVNLQTRHRISQHLNISIATDVNLAHLVYIFSTRSADNTWNRIIRLVPKIEYIPSKNFTTLNMFEVLANYTVYDYEYTTSTTRSFVFRQFAFVDSSTLSVTNRLSLEWYNHLRLYERGELRWDVFAEKPINYFEDKTFLGSVHYVVGEGLLFTVGIRYFSQSRFKFIGSTRMLENYLRSFGPTAGIEVNIAARTNVAIHGWYEHQTQTDQPSRNVTTMTMFLNLYL